MNTVKVDFLKEALNHINEIINSFEFLKNKNDIIVSRYKTILNLTEQLEIVNTVLDCGDLNGNKKTKEDLKNKIVVLINEQIENVSSHLKEIEESFKNTKLKNELLSILANKSSSHFPAITSSSITPSSVLTTPSKCSPSITSILYTLKELEKAYLEHYKTKKHFVISYDFTMETVQEASKIDTFTPISQIIKEILIYQSCVKSEIDSQNEN